MRIPFLKKIDLYIIRKFLGTFLFALLLIILIVVIFDISEKIDDFIAKSAPIKAIVFDYYFNFVPYFANLFASMFIFIAVIFFTSKMAGDSEIIAILASGVSYKRLMRPYLVAATLLAIFTMVLINWVIPPANQKRIEFESKYIKNRYVNTDRDIHRQIMPGQFAYMESYNATFMIGYKFSLEQFENGQLKSKMLADYIQWDTTQNKWRISNCFIRTYDSVGNETIVQHRRIDTTLNMVPADYAHRDNIVEAMNRRELIDFIALERMRGSDNIVVWELERHRRFASVFSTFVLTLIGVTLSSRKRRGGIGLNIALGILLAFSYIMFMQVSTVLSTNADLPPIIAVWVPNIIFGVIGIFLYSRARK